MAIEPRPTSFLVAPVITGVVDSESKPLPDNDTTEDNVLTLSGTGSANSAVIIADNNEPVTLAQVSERGEWVETVAASLGIHSYTLRLSNEAWVITVVDAVVAPTIITVRDSRGDVANGGSTYDTSITVGGRAATDQQVEILDKAHLLGTVTALGGEWAITLSALAFKGYSLKARGLYGSIPESAIRAFNVIYAGEDFETGTVGVIPVDTVREYPAMMVMPRGKDASLVIDSIAAPIVAGQAISLADESVVRFFLRSPVNKIKFGAFASASIPGIVPPILACFDEQDALIFERKLDFGL